MNKIQMLQVVQLRAMLFEAIQSLFIDLIWENLENCLFVLSSLWTLDNVSMYEAGLDILDPLILMAN